MDFKLGFESQYLFCTLGLPILNPLTVKGVVQILSDNAKLRT